MIYKFLGNFYIILEQLIINLIKYKYDNYSEREIKKYFRLREEINNN